MSYSPAASRWPLASASHRCTAVPSVSDTPRGRSRPAHWAIAIAAVAAAVPVIAEVLRESNGSSTAVDVLRILLGVTLVAWGVLMWIGRGAEQAGSTCACWPPRKPRSSMTVSKVPVAGVRDVQVRRRLDRARSGRPAANRSNDSASAGRRPPIVPGMGSSSTALLHLTGLL